MLRPASAWGDWTIIVIFFFFVIFSNAFWPSRGG
jgi:hypothetical protein